MLTSFLRRIRGIYAAALTVVVLTGGMALGQAVSQISGTTKDQSGAVIPGVEVTATQTDTGTKRTAVSSATGDWVIPDLQIGPYRLEATKQGFEAYVQTGIQLQVDSSPVVGITLNVGDVAQTLEVQANATQVETERLGVASVMENQRILDLPLNGRNPTDLIALTGAAVQIATSPTYSMGTGVTISVAGGLDFGVFYSLDGAPHLNLYDSTGMPLPFPDALQEFKVETSTQGAGTGTKSGAQITSVTKSGTNGFHGDAFEFLRNGDVNARNFFSTIPDNLKRNQYGGTLGGPAIKNKLFFFGGFQGTTLRQSPAPTTSFVPTTAMLAGDFSTFASAACQGKNVTLSAPFTTINGKPNQLPASLISQQGLNIAKNLPAPLNQQCGQYLSYSPISQYFWQVPVRVDYQVSDKQSVFFRYLATKQDQVVPHDLNKSNDINVGNNGLDDMAQSVTLGHTWLISGSKVNSFRLSSNRISLNHREDPYFSASDAGINAFAYVPDTILLSVSGGPTVGSGTGLDKRSFYTYLSGNDDFTWIHGAHQFAFGVDEMHSLTTSIANAFSSGQYNFTGVSTGLGLADLLAGQLSSIRQEAPNDLRQYQWFFGAYAQDTWKVSRRLTLNYGLRWEPFFPMQIKDKEIYNFSLAGFYAGKVSTVWTNAPAGFTYPGDPGFHGESGIQTGWRNLEPRIGFAYDPFGDGKTSIRAGAGIAYDFMNEASYSNADASAPFAGNITVVGPVPLANPWSTTPGGDPFPYLATPPRGTFPAGSQYIPVPANFRTPESYSWNVAIQRQITARLFASASYLGSHAIHLPDLYELNPGVLLNVPSVAAGSPLCNATTLAVNCTANLNVRRVLNLANPVAAQAISNITAFDDGATSSYNGMLLTAAWKATDNVNVNTNYTWSHCVGEATNGDAVPNPGSNYVHQNNRSLDAGNCTQDRRNIINLTVAARAPKFSNRAVNLIASGWSLSTIYRYSSGAPLTILSGLDQALVGFNTNERVQQVLTNTAAVNQGGACANTAPCVTWLNPAAFAQPALGTFGNIGVTNVLGPHFFQFDSSLVREFRLRERQTLQVRFEAFNVLNNVRFNNPAVSYSASTTFGTITSAQDPRILQLAMKFLF